MKEASTSARIFLSILMEYPETMYSLVCSHTSKLCNSILQESEEKLHSIRRILIKVFIFLF